MLADGTDIMEGSYIKILKTQLYLEILGFTHSLFPIVLYKKSNANLQKLAPFHINPTLKKSKSASMPIVDQYFALKWLENSFEICQKLTR